MSYPGEREEAKPEPTGEYDPRFFVPRGTVVQVAWSDASEPRWGQHVLKDNLAFDTYESGPADGEYVFLRRGWLIRVDAANVEKREWSGFRK